MSERKFRPVDCTAGVLAIAGIWLMVRGGFTGEFTALHAWGLFVGGIALAVGMWAMGSCIADRIVRRIAQRIERRLPGMADEAVRRAALDELSRPR